jgi:sodium/potassium/calcium exchanger 6
MLLSVLDFQLFIVIIPITIDTLADKLVDVLDFLGVVLRVPNSIMGLTVLAWGNSMADLSANVTMARKGLANMAITVSTKFFPSMILV